MKCVIALFVTLLQFRLMQCSFDAAVAVKNTEFLITAAYPCEGADTIAYIEIEMKDDGNEKWVEFMFQSDVTLDNTFRGNMIVDQWKNGAWEENMYNTDGIICDLRNRFASKAWKKLVEATEPKGDASICDIPAGTYTSKKFQLDPGDMDIPSMLFGTFRVRFEVYTGDNDLFYCNILEAKCNPV